MKRLLQSTSSLVVILALTAAAMWLVWSVSGQQRSSVQATPSSQEPVQWTIVPPEATPVAQVTVTRTVEGSERSVPDPDPSATPQLDFETLAVEGVEDIPTGPYRTLLWSPDGTKALIGKEVIPSYFLTRGEQSSMITSLTDLWVLDLETGQERRLADRRSHVTWAPDSRRVAYIAPTGTAGIAGALYVVDIATAETRAIAPVDFLGAEYGPHWLPGDEIVFVRDGRLWTVRPDGREEQAMGLTFQSRTGAEAGKPVYMSDDQALIGYQFSPTGRRMAYLTRHSDERVQSVLLWLADTDGNNPHLISNQAESSYYEWSPDGEWLTFNALGSPDDSRADDEPGKINELWVVRADGSNTQRLYRTDNWRWILSPTWSPNSQLIVFLEQRFLEDGPDKNRDVWLADVAGGRTRKLYPANQEVASILDMWWSPDGAYLYIIRDVDVSLLFHVSNRLKLSAR